MVSSQLLYVLLVGAVALERVYELRIARRNRALALSRGGREHGAAHFPWMAGMHTLFLVACVAEVLLLDRAFAPTVALPALVTVALAQALRYWCIRLLGERWNVRVIVVPGMVLERGGPYRFVRHPNYVAVVLEIVALPLVHGAWLTAVVFSLANAAVLWVRIRVEERALSEVGT